MKTKKFETTLIHKGLERVGGREIAVEISEWSDVEGQSKRTAKIQIWNLTNRKNYAVWLPFDEGLPVLKDMIEEALKVERGNDD